MLEKIVTDAVSQQIFKIFEAVTLKAPGLVMKLREYEVSVAMITPRPAARAVAALGEQGVTKARMKGWVAVSSAALSA